jgi:hypothetical protein
MAGPRKVGSGTPEFLLSSMSGIMPGVCVSQYGGNGIAEFGIAGTILTSVLPPIETAGAVIKPAPPFVRVMLAMLPSTFTVAVAQAPYPPPPTMWTMGEEFGA